MGLDLSHKARIDWSCVRHEPGSWHSCVFNSIYDNGWIAQVGLHLFLGVGCNCRECTCFWTRPKQQRCHVPNMDTTARSLTSVPQRLSVPPTQSPLNVSSFFLLDSSTCRGHYGDKVMHETILCNRVCYGRETVPSCRGQIGVEERVEGVDGRGKCLNWDFCISDPKRGWACGFKYIHTSVSRTTWARYRCAVRLGLGA